MICPFAMKWQDKPQNMRHFHWPVEKFDGSLFVGDTFLQRANDEQKWIFKTDVITYFVDNVSNWNEKIA